MMLGLPLLALQLNLIHVSDTINTAAAGANNEIVVITVCLLGILGIVGSFDIALGPVTWVYTAEAFDYMSRTQGSSYAVISVVGSYHLLKFCNCWRSICSTGLQVQANWASKFVFLSKFLTTHLASSRSYEDMARFLVQM
ncbi:hypothetical protein LINPERHAP2_LOCUS24420 [Linum perenne]